MKNNGMGIGADDAPIIVSCTVPLTEGLVMAMDPLFGQQIVVRQAIGPLVWDVRLVTNEREEDILKGYFDGKIIWYKLYTLLGEHSSSASIPPTISGETTLRLLYE